MKFARAHRWTLPLFVAVLFIATLRAGEEAQSITIKADEIAAPYVRWYGVYGPDGAKMGYGRLEFLGKKGDVYQESMHLVMKIAALGKTMEMEMKENKSFSTTPPFALVGATSSMTNRT